MAGEKISYVDPDAGGTGSGDDWTNAYTSLSAAISDNVAGTGQVTSADLVTNTETWVVNCRSSSGTADTTAATISGFTTSTDYDITVNGDNTSGQYNTSAYRIEITSAANFTRGLRILDDYVTMNDLQVQLTNTGNYTGNAGYETASGQTSIAWNRCIFKCGGMSGTGELRGFYMRDSTQTAYNCLAYDIIGGSATVNVGFSTTGTTYNCTVYNCEYGFSSSTSITAKNCLTMSCTDGFNGGFIAGSDYNASDIASDAPGANSNNGTAASFIDAAGGDFTLANGDTVALDQGDDLSGTFTDDLKGKTRSIWSIGAIESAGVVYINDAATLDGGEVEQTYPGAANWADGQIDMQNVPDKGALTGQLYVLVELPNGSVASRAVTIGTSSLPSRHGANRGIARGVMRGVG